MNGADWAFMGYQRPDEGFHLDGKYWVIGTNQATHMRLEEDADWSFSRDMLERVLNVQSIIISVHCRSYVMAVGNTYAEALQRCMAELERADPDRKWYEPKQPPALRPSHPSLGEPE